MDAVDVGTRTMLDNAQKGHAVAATHKRHFKIQATSDMSPIAFFPVFVFALDGLVIGVWVAVSGVGVLCSSGHHRAVAEDGKRLAKLRDFEDEQAAERKGVGLFAIIPSLIR